MRLDLVLSLPWAALIRCEDPQSECGGETPESAEPSIVRPGASRSLANDRSKRNSPTLGPGFPSVAHGAVSLKLLLSAPSGSDARVTA